MSGLLSWAWSRSFIEASVWSVLINLAVFWAALGFGELVKRWTAAGPILVPRVTRVEQVLAGVCVLGNSLVMLLGWRLFQNGVLEIHAGLGLGQVLADAAILVVVMDIAMFLTHRLAHVPIAYRHIHGVHHRYVQVRPLSLFVLHPLEVLAFGGLWICVLMSHAFSLEGMLLYLTFNTVLGILGHLGFEPLPQRWLTLPVLRNLGSSSFHARHHLNPNVNFGFYTTVWDRMLRSLDATTGSTSAGRD